MPQEKKPIIFNEFNGLADSLWSGQKGSFYKFIGLDGHSKRGAVQAQQRLAKDSGTTITDLCKVSLTVSDNSRLWFSYTTGKIWRESGGTYTLVYTTVPTTGNTGCLGAREYNGNIYWATQNYEHYIAVANIGTATLWTNNAVPNWKLFSVTDSSWHPHEVVNATLFIGDGNRVDSVNSANTYTSNVLDLIKPNKIKCMKAYDIDLVIGTWNDPTNLSVNNCWVVRWDTIQTSWQFMEPVAENGINCLFWSGQTLLANAGQYGMIYHFNGKTLLPYKRIPALNNPWGTSHNGEILPNAAGVWNNLAVFGFTSNTGNPTDNAVYTLGAYTTDHHAFLSEDFPISSGNLTSITPGTIVVSNELIYVAWQDTVAVTQGVDKIDYSNLYASAYLETKAIPLDELPELFTQIQRIFCLWQSKPANTSITFGYYANWGSLTTPTNSVVNEATYQTSYVDEGIDCRTIRIRMSFTVSGNSGMVVEALGILPSNG